MADSDDDLNKSDGIYNMFKKNENEKLLNNLNKPRLERSDSKGISKELEEFVVLSSETLDTREAYSPEFISKWKKLAQSGVFVTGRSKHIENKNITHELKSAPKPMSLKAKTIGLLSFGTGHLTAADGGKLDYMDIKKKGGQEVAKVVYNEGKGDVEELFVTFERQSLNYIQSQVENGNYIIESINKEEYVDIQGNHHESIYHIAIRDREDQEVMIRLSEFGEPTWKRNTVAKLINRYNLASSSKTSSDKKPSLVSDKLKEEFAKIATSKFFVNHLDDTVKLLRYSSKNKVVDERPHILSDDKGYPMKGDVDIQNTFLPSSLPPESFELLYLSTDTKNQNKAVDLVAKLRDLADKIDVNLLKDPKYAELLKTYDSIINPQDDSFRAKRTRINYDELFEDADFKSANSFDKKELLKIGLLKIMHAVLVNKDSANALVSSMGSISLFGAAMVTALGTEILHGPEAGTPIFPENITVTNTQNPSDPNFSTVFQTHSEFEYLSLLHKNDDFFKNKVMDFNPCWFTEAPEVFNEKADKYERWRKDLPGKGETRDAHGNLRVCKNLEYESSNIELWKLLFEKQLLLYKKSTPEQYTKYAEVLANNFKTMPEHPFTKTKVELVAALESGGEKANAIMSSVSEYDNDDIDRRLAEIKEITSGDEKTMRANLETSSNRRGRSSSDHP